MSWDDEWVELKNGDRVRKDDVIHYNKRMGKAVYRLRNDSGINYTEETLEEFDEAMGRVKHAGFIGAPRFNECETFKPEWDDAGGGCVTCNYHKFNLFDVLVIDDKSYFVSAVCTIDGDQTISFHKLTSSEVT